MEKLLVKNPKSFDTERYLALVIFTARESLTTLVATLEAALNATDTNTVINVLVNGNLPLAMDLNLWLIGCLNKNDKIRIKIWSISTGDKANAWNQYFHKIWSGEDLAFFLDGYVRLRSDSITLLRNAVESNQSALGGSGVPTTGHSAKHIAAMMIAEGGFHGNFCCVRGTAIAEIRRQNFRIPLGLYRTDSLVGAALTFGLDPENREWDIRRIVVEPLATWSTPPENWWSYRGVTTLVKRRLRQARGILENAALKEHMAIRRLPLNKIPKIATALVNEWMICCPTNAEALIRKNPITRLILPTYTQVFEWTENDLIPEKIDFDH